MATCEDWPCCGHEAGCCPDYDPITGRQLNMVCICGAKVPLGGPSLCRHCLSLDDDGYSIYHDEGEEFAEISDGYDGEYLDE